VFVDFSPEKGDRGLCAICPLRLCVRWFSRLGAASGIRATGAFRTEVKARNEPSQSARARRWIASCRLNARAQSGNRSKSKAPLIEPASTSYPILTVLGNMGHTAARMQECGRL